MPVEPVPDEDVLPSHPDAPDSQDPSDTDSQDDLLDPASVDDDLVVDAGDDFEAPEGELVTLDGSRSHGPGELLFTWTQVSGVPVTLSATDQPVVTFVAPEGVADDAEPLVFSLTVERVDAPTKDKDSEGLSEKPWKKSDLVSIIIKRQSRSPVASFTANPLTGPAPLTVRFDASASYDPDGTVVAYTWDFGDGGAGSGVTASHEYAVAGNYQVVLAVRDNLGASGLATARVRVSPSDPDNSAPTVDPGDPQVIMVTEACPLHGMVDDDGLPNPPGNVATTWSVLSGPGSVAFGDASALDTTATFSDPGMYELELTAEDSALSGSATVTVYVLPVITIDVSPASVNVDETVYFTAEVDGRPIEEADLPVGATSLLKWSFGDGNVGYGPQTSHVYSSGGTYQVALTLMLSGLGLGEIGCSQNTADVQGLRISGRVTSSGGAGIDGVAMVGLPGNPLTNASGYYSGTVNYGDSVTVTPSKPGYTFLPDHRSYSNVTASLPDQDYTATAQTLTISGRVTTSGGAAISGVTINGLPGNPLTDASGYYSATVNYDFSGTATPSKAGYTFSPASRTYSHITANQTNHNYTGTLQTFTISGRVTAANGSPISGVTINGLPGSPVSNASGDYSATVGYGFSGAITASKPGYTFIPANRVYANITANAANQNYIGILNTYTISGRVTDSDGAPISGVVMSGLPNNPQTNATGDYSGTVNHGTTVTVTPTKAGYTFTPASRAYPNLAGSHANQDYVGEATDPDCVTSSATWQNVSFVQQTGTFTAEFDAVPGADNIDAVIALSAGPGADYSDFPVLVRFNDLGVIDARDGGTYAGSVPYTAGTSYHVRLVINVSAQTYSVYVTPQGTAEQMLGLDFGFRNAAASLANWGLICEIGTCQVCNFTIGAVPTFTISGRVATSGGTSVSGVAINGLPGTPLTDASGNYTATVDSGFGGTATPAKAGYTFSPVSRTYSNVTANQTQENYTATSQSTGTNAIAVWGVHDKWPTSGMANIGIAAYHETGIRDVTFSFGGAASIFSATVTEERLDPSTAPIDTLGHPGYPYYYTTIDTTRVPDGDYLLSATVTPNSGVPRTLPQITLRVCNAADGVRYVDGVNGNDSWDGTSGTRGSGTVGPWQTLTKAATTATQASGITKVIVAAGSYAPTRGAAGRTSYLKWVAAAGAIPKIESTVAFASESFNVWDGFDLSSTGYVGEPKDPNGWYLGLNLSNKDHVIYRNCTLHRPSDDHLYFGVAAINTPHLAFVDCAFRGWGTGIAVYNAPYGSVPTTTHVIVRNCRFTKSMGSMAFGFKHALIEGCKSYDMANYRYPGSNDHPDGIQTDFNSPIENVVIRSNAFWNGGNNNGNWNFMILGNASHHKDFAIYNNWAQIYFQAAYSSFAMNMDGTTDHMCYIHNTTLVDVHGQPAFGMRTRPPWTNCVIRNNIMDSFILGSTAGNSIGHNVYRLSDQAFYSPLQAGDVIDPNLGSSFVDEYGYNVRLQATALYRSGKAHDGTNVHVKFDFNGVQRAPDAPSRGAFEN